MTTASQVPSLANPVASAGDLDIATQGILEGLARLHTVVLVSDMQGEIVWVSDAIGSACGGAERYVGRRVEDLLLSLPGARARARLTEQVSQIRNHLRHHESLHDVRFDLGSRDGTAHNLDVSAFRVSSQSGRALVVAIVHPEAHTRVSDPILRGERDALGSILDSSPDAVIAIDRFGFITHANPAVGPVLGFEREKLLGRPVALFLPRSPAFVRFMSRVRGTGALQDAELEIEHADGRTVWIAITTREHVRSDGRRLGTVVFASDVTKRVLATRELERKNAELESYVHSVSHDLRSPLVSLIGFTRLLREDYDAKLDKTGRHFTERIEQAARTMESLIHDLLELSRIGSAHEKRTLVDPRTVLLQLEAELKLRLDDADARLEIPEDPPLLLCDRMRLYQLFSNLVGNALQHMGECDDRRITIGIDSLAARDLISVRDRGRGIPETDHERIFEVFQSRGKTADGRRSTGIGLAIVKKIAEIHNGRAWVESELGSGACFYVSLPHA